MEKACFQETGRQFYAWHKAKKIRLEYKISGGDVELELKRMVGLIDYVENKKAALKSTECDPVIKFIRQ